MAVTLRHARSEDEEFLFELYCSTRRDELATFGWDEVQQLNFLKLQFTAQQHHYSPRFSDAEHNIILLDDDRVGRLIVIRTRSEIRLADIALLPQYRGAGIGSSLVKDLLAEGAASRRPVTLHVDKSNRAARLYERLGFVKKDDTGTHFFMERLPNS